MSHFDHKHRKPLDKGERIRILLLMLLVFFAFCLAGYIDMHSGVH